MKTLRSTSGMSLPFLALALSLLVPAVSLADGCLVVPKFVWDKHKDINEPTQKAIIVYDAGHEDLILQVKYEGPTDEFGWLVPVPNQPQVKEGSMKCFYELSRYTQRQFERPQYEARSAGFGSEPAGATPAAEPPVQVVEIKTVGVYTIAVLSTKDSSALAKWLDANQFYFPAEKTDVLDEYVKMQFHFVAVKINLGRSKAVQTARAGKLANGELNPLQISFASDQCVFPLKISSVNGKPSEVQVYVLSPEPLLERRMLEKKLPLMYGNDVARAAKLAQSMRESEERLARIRPSPWPKDPEREAALQKMREPEAYPDEVLPFAKVAKTDLPDTCESLPRLAKDSWWLTKQTWTFEPGEMRDLVFEPAIPVFSNQLATKYGYFAVANLASLGADALPALLAALQSDNRAMRINAAAVLDRQMKPLSDPRLAAAAVGWLKDSEPAVRTTAVRVLTDDFQWKPQSAGLLVTALRDPDAGVVRAIVRGLARHSHDMTNQIPVIQSLLKDEDARVRVSLVKLLLALQVEVPRSVILPLLNIPDRELFGRMAALYRHPGPDGLLRYDLSNDEALPLFQNPDPLGRMIGLNVAYGNANAQSVELALPLLKDPDAAVRARAAATLRALTGQHFTENQTDQWRHWWDANKINFAVQLHPEELRPQRFRRPGIGPDATLPPDVQRPIAPPPGN